MQLNELHASEQGNAVIFVPFPAIPASSRTSGSLGPPVIGSCRHSMRAQSCRLGTVATITGDIDAANIDVVLDFASLFMPIANTGALDLSGVEFFAAQSISLLVAVDDLCRTADASWVLIPSHAVSRVMRLTNRDTTLTTACAVPEGLRGLAEITRARRGVSPQRRHWSVEQ